MVRSAYELHSQDDDFGQVGTVVRAVCNDAQRAEFVDNVTGHLLVGVTVQVLRGHSSTGRTSAATPASRSSRTFKPPATAPEAATITMRRPCER